MSEFDVTEWGEDWWLSFFGISNPLISGTGGQAEDVSVEQSVPRSHKSGRPKSDATIALGKAAHDALAASPYAMTLRQLYYALVSAGAIEKDEASYNKLKRVMRDLREDGSVPWEWLVDHTRAVFQPRTWDGIEGLLTDSAKLYRRDLMRQQDVAIQLWAESDSIGSVIAQVADRYTIPTFIGRGYAARGYLWAAAKDTVAAHEAGKSVLILHVGDYDPSGEDIYRDVEKTLRLYATAIQLDRPVAQVQGLLEGMHGSGYESIEGCTTWMDFERLALTPDQIDEYHLPTRPAKTADVRTAKFTGSGTVEVEALPVEALLEVVEQAIVDSIDPEALRTAELAEQSERDIARRIAGTPIGKLLEASA